MNDFFNAIIFTANEMADLLAKAGRRMQPVTPRYGPRSKRSTNNNTYHPQRRNPNVSHHRQAPTRSPRAAKYIVPAHQHQMYNNNRPPPVFRDNRYVLQPQPVAIDPRYFPSLCNLPPPPQHTTINLQPQVHNYHGGPPAAYGNLRF